METIETIEKIENIRTEQIKTPVECIVSDKNDHKAIFNLKTEIIQKTINLTGFKEDLLSIRESGNISVRETQKVLTTLCKTISAMTDYTDHLQTTAYNIEHHTEIHEEKRALRDMIKDASPDQMAEFRAFLKATKESKESKESTKEPEKTEKTD